MQIGYPDFQAYPAVRGPVYAAQGFSVTSAAPATKGEYVTSFASVYLSLYLSSGTGVTVSVAFYTDSTLAAKTATWQYTVTLDVTLSVVLPVLGNYFVLEISTGQSGTQAGDYSLIPSQLQYPVQRYPTPVVPQSGNVTIGASGSEQYGFAYVMEGNGYLNVVANDTSGQIWATVRELGENNSPADYLAAGFLPTTDLESLTLTWIAGTAPVVIYLLNTDSGASHQCTYYGRILAL